MKQLEARKEHDRINLLRGNHLMGEDDIFVEMNADDPLSYLGIANLMSASPQTLTQPPPPPARHEAVIRSLRCIYTLNPSIDFEYISMGVWIDC